jgi:capsular polysaccharide transport system permease protein
MADEDEDEEQLAKPRSRPNRVNFLDRLKFSVPALFPAEPLSDVPEQIQLLYSLRANRFRSFLFRNGIFVVLPSLLVLIYTGLIATPRYVCTFQETYQVYQPTSTLSSTPVQSMVSSADAVDYGAVIDEYIQSAALATQLDEQIHLRDHYSNAKIDWFSRLKKNASNAKYLSYYNSHVLVSEGFGGYITVTVQGFDPAFTLLLAKTINQDADAMLDGMTTQARQVEVKAATDQLNDASTALDVANQNLTTFRNAHGDLDPSMIATELGTIEGTLESQLAGLRAQLEQAQANMQPNASQIVQLNLQVAAVNKQLSDERLRLAANNGQTSYSNTVAAYETLVSDQQLATTTFQAAQQGLVLAKADAANKQSYVVDFVQPVLPDGPTVPNPLTSTLMAFLGCVLAFSIGNLLITALRDQSGI